MTLKRRGKNNKGMVCVWGGEGRGGPGGKLMKVLSKFRLWSGAPDPPLVRHVPVFTGKRFPITGEK